ncbi:MAG TPA: major capsid protein [Sphingomonas sp.]
MTGNLSYDTATLVAVVPNLKLSQNWLLDRFFPNIVESTSEEVAIDVDIGKRRMAPFVSPLVAGKLVEQRRYQTNKFAPAYVKDKRAPDLRKPVKRMIGERIGGDLTGAEREMANLNAEMADQVDILNRRLEWMGASALSSGSVTIQGEGFETVVINFGRDAALSIALTGANKWGAGLNSFGRDPKIVGQIEAWGTRILQKSGAVATDIVFTPSAWSWFLLAEGVQGAIQYPTLAMSGNQVDPGPRPQLGAVYKGRWGNYDLWLYNDWFVNDIDNIEYPMLADGTIIMSGPQLQGTRAFGMILDPEFNYQPMAYAPKTWVEKDPAQRILLMQCAPIVIPSRVNASLAAVVCDPIVVAG